MKPIISAGLLMYKINQGVLEVLLGHPGGPYYFDRDEEVWSIPKGQAETNETLLDTAIREFAEETGLGPPTCGLLPLGHVATGKKRIHIWAFAATAMCRNYAATCFLWSGRRDQGSCRSSEFDRLAFLPVPEARRKIERSQVAFFDKLLLLLALSERKTISA